MKTVSLIAHHKQYRCHSGVHLWLHEDQAQRCCAGYAPIRVPMAFQHKPREWSEQPIEQLYDYMAWSRILIPEQETDLYRKLWVRQPTAYQSSTGPINPGLNIEN